MTIPMTHSGTKKAERSATKNRFSREYESLLTEFKRERTGYSAIAIIAQSCIGSVAAMLLLMSGLQVFPKMGLLFITIILCMAFNAAVLAQLKSRTTFNILIISVLFSVTVIISNLI